MGSPPRFLSHHPPQLSGRSTRSSPPPSAPAADEPATSARRTQHGSRAAGGGGTAGVEEAVCRHLLPAAASWWQRCLLAILGICCCWQLAAAVARVLGSSPLLASGTRCRLLASGSQPGSAHRLGPPARGQPMRKRVLSTRGVKPPSARTERTLSAPAPPRRRTLWLPAPSRAGPPTASGMVAKCTARSRPVATWPSAAALTTQRQSHTSRARPLAVPACIMMF